MTHRRGNGGAVGPTTVEAFGDAIRQEQAIIEERAAALSDLRRAVSQAPRFGS